MPDVCERLDLTAKEGITNKAFVTPPRCTRVSAQPGYGPSRPPPEEFGDCSRNFFRIAFTIDPHPLEECLAFARDTDHHVSYPCIPQADLKPIRRMNAEIQGYATGDTPSLTTTKLLHPICCPHSGNAHIAANKKLKELADLEHDQ